MKAVLLVLAIAVALPASGQSQDEYRLYMAIKAGQAGGVAALLARGVTARGEFRESTQARPLLTFAAEGGNEEIVALLLQHGADANARNSFPLELFRLHGTAAHRYPDNKKSALMYAAEAGHVGVVRQLLKAGADPNLSTVYDETALMFAAGNGCVETLRALIDAGAKLNAAAGDTSFETRGRDNYGGTALVYALRAGISRPRVVNSNCGEVNNAASAILDAYEKTRTRVGDAHGAVSIAVLRGDAKVVSRLVALGAVRRGSDALLNVGMNPRDNSEIVRLLAAAGADVNARMQKPYDETVLMRAADAGSEATVLALLEAGADINAANTFGDTALWNAARANRPEMVELLLKRGADPNRLQRPNPQWFSGGGTALNIAVERQCMECARLLLAGGANPRVPDANGRTPEGALREAGLLK